MVGQDRDNNEFWFFKDDSSKLFVKKADDSSSQWYFIDEEAKLDQLYDSLNPKGIKEKKLQESLKKIRVSLKLKKAKLPKTAVQTDNNTAEEKDKVETPADDDAKMEDEEKRDGDQSVEEKESEKHHLFENDQYEQTIINATWYNKTMPKRRGNYAAGIRGTRGRIA